MAAATTRAPRPAIPHAASAAFPRLTNSFAYFLVITSSSASDRSLGDASIRAASSSAVLSTPDGYRPTSRIAFVGAHSAVTSPGFSNWAGSCTTMAYTLEKRRKAMRSCSTPLVAHTMGTTAFHWRSDSWIPGVS